MKHQKFEITAEEVGFLEEARDTFRQVIQGNTDYRSEEALKAFAALMCIMPRLAPTWNGGGDAA